MGWFDDVRLGRPSRDASRFGTGPSLAALAGLAARGWFSGGQGSRCCPGLMACDDGFVIVVEESSVVIDGATLLHPVTFHVSRGEAMAIRGANGSGKTTLLRLLTGQLSPSTGVVTVDGNSPNLRNYQFRTRMAGMIGLPPLARDLTVREHTTLVGVSWGWSVKAARAAAEDILDQLGLARLADRFPHELSSGQTQLAGLAVTLVRPSELLVLDEPEQRLDQDRLTGLLDLLRRRQKAGTTIAVATHHDRVVQALNARPLGLREVS